MTAQSTISAIREVGSITMLTTETEIRTVDGEHVCTGFSTLVERGEAERGTSPVSYADVVPGHRAAPVTYPVTRLSLVKYCGASGDFNVIHWNERIARSVGLPDVIAHGMFTMAQAGRYVTDWAGDAGAMVEFGVRFSAPVVVPDDDMGATIEVSGTVEDKLDGNRVVLGLTARSGRGQGADPGPRGRAPALIVAGADHG